MLCSILLLLNVRWKMTAVEEEKYPFPVQHFKFFSQEKALDMAYMYRQARRPNGTTVLLLHGKNFSGAYWGGVMRKLLARGYDVLAPDQAGFGKSSMETDYQYSFQQLARNTKQLIDTLGIKKVIVLGHSMGGMLATRFALMYPEITQQLVLEDPIGLEDYKVKVPYASIDEEFKKELGKTKESVKKYMMENYFHNEWKSEYDALLLPTTHDIDPGSPGFSDHAKCMALTSDMIFTQPVCYEFGKLHVPAVLIIGQKDRTAIGKDRVDKKTAETMGDYPALGKTTAAQIPSCVLVEIPDAGHIPHVEDFDLFMEKLFSVLK